MNAHGINLGGKQLDAKIQRDIEILRKTPAVVRVLLGELSDLWFLADEGPGTWSPFDIVGHFIDGEENDWIPRARIILKHGAEQPFTPFDRNGFTKIVQGKTLSQLLYTFEYLRELNCRTLEKMNLTVEQLQLKGIHPEFGEVTMDQLISTWVVHDLDHIAQIVRVMAKSYREEVGPWEAYLPIIQR